jgi:ElaB/YqjD/DUF883 family membrane-anchored ribosome-binding protein
MAATTTSAKRQAAAPAKRAKEEAADAAADIGKRARASGEALADETDEIEASLARGAEELAATVSSKLRAVGVDTDRLVDVAREQASDLEELIVREIRERPLRALGLAAAVGLFVGFLSAR